MPHTCHHALRAVYNLHALCIIGLEVKDAVDKRVTDVLETMKGEAISMRLTHAAVHCTLSTIQAWR